MAETKSMLVEGQRIDVPADATPDEMMAAAEQWASSPDYDKIIDKKTGAPARVRMLVGSAPEADRLPALVRLYPGCPYR